MWWLIVLLARTGVAGSPGHGTLSAKTRMIPGELPGIATTLVGFDRPVQSTVNQISPGCLVGSSIR